MSLESSLDERAQVGCAEYGLSDFDGLVRRARTCRRFDEEQPVSKDLLVELVNLARLSPCGGNMQKLRFCVVTDAEERDRVFEQLTWAAALKDWPGPAEGERPTGYVAIFATRPAPGKPAAPMTDTDCGIAAQTMMLAARAATPQLGACMFKAFHPTMVDVLGVDGDLYELKLVMAFGVPAEAQVLEPVSASPNGKLTYWRTEDQVHHVPKLALDDVLLQS